MARIVKPLGRYVTCQHCGRRIAYWEFHNHRFVKHLGNIISEFWDEIDGRNVVVICENCNNDSEFKIPWVLIDSSGNTIEKES